MKCPIPYPNISPFMGPDMHSFSFIWDLLSTESTDGKSAGDFLTVLSGFGGFVKNENVWADH